MIILKIKEAGHTIAIPGTRVSRSPISLDISKLDIRVVSMYLKTSGIEQYEIVAESPQGDKETYTRKDFDVTEKKKVEPKQDDVVDKIDKLEQMMKVLIDRESSKSSSDKEQINNKLDKIEKLFKHEVQAVDKTPARREVIKRGEPEIEELDAFIPEVDISDMKLSSENIKTVKKDDEGNEDAVDMLSSLIRRG